MKVLSGKEFARLLESKGWLLRRTQSSHHIYVREGRTDRISVPVHANRSLKVGLQKHLMKIAGIHEGDL